MLLDFTKKQFSGLAGDYTSSKGKRDILREAVLVGGWVAFGSAMQPAC